MVMSLSSSHIYAFVHYYFSLFFSPASVLCPHVFILIVTLLFLYSSTQYMCMNLRWLYSLFFSFLLFLLFMQVLQSLTTLAIADIGFIPTGLFIQLGHIRSLNLSGNHLTNTSLQLLDTLPQIEVSLRFFFYFFSFVRYLDLHFIGFVPLLENAEFRNSFEIKKFF